MTFLEVSAKYNCNVLCVRDQQTGDLRVQFDFNDNGCNWRHSVMMNQVELNVLALFNEAEDQICMAAIESFTNREGVVENG